MNERLVRLPYEMERDHRLIDAEADCLGAGSLDGFARGASVPQAGKSGFVPSAAFFIARVAPAGNSASVWISLPSLRTATQIGGFFFCDSK